MSGRAADEDEEEEEFFSPGERESSPESSSDYERRHHRHGRHRTRRGHRHGRHRTRRGHRCRSFSPVRTGAAGEVTSPQTPLVSETNIVMLNELLDRSLREDGLTSKIADVLSALTGRVQSNPPESSNPSAGSSVPSVPSASVNTRMTMTDFGAVSIFSGNDNDKKSILNVMAQYEAFVTAALKSLPGRRHD